MNRSKINIGTYYLAPYAHSEEHIKDLAECGIDMVINMRYVPEVFDLFSKYGVGAIVTGIFPGWFGGNGDNAGTMECTNPIEKYDSAAVTFEEHPAIWGIDTGDEPSSWDFPHYGKIFERVKEQFQGYIPYLNIYPSYAVSGKNTPEEVNKQLGTLNYASYIESFCENVKSDYICCDYYLYSADIGRLYETFLTVSKACVKEKRQMWTVLQVNSHQEDVWIPLEQLRFQAGVALAFGAEVITWACYTAGWWFNHVLDKQGNKTKQYEKLKKVNKEIHALSDSYMKYRHVETKFVGDFSKEELERTGVTPVSVLNTCSFYDLKIEQGHKLLAGIRKMQDSDEEALVLCLADDPYGNMETSCQVSFRAEKENIKAIGRSDFHPLILCEDGSYRIEIRSNETILLCGLEK